MGWDLRTKGAKRIEDPACYSRNSGVMLCRKKWRCFCHQPPGNAIWNDMATIKLTKFEMVSQENRYETTHVVGSLTLKLFVSIG